MYFKYCIPCAYSRLLITKNDAKIKFIHNQLTITIGYNTFFFIKQNLSCQFMFVLNIMYFIYIIILIIKGNTSECVPKNLLRLLAKKHL